MGIVIARTLNATGYGSYSIYSAIFVLATSWIGFGAPTQTFKAISQFHGNGQHGHSRQFLQKVMGFVAFTGLATLGSTGLCLSFGLVDDQPAIKQVLLYGMIAAIPFAMVRILFEAMQGVGKVAAAMFMENNLIPLFMILACAALPLFLETVKPEQLMVINIGGFILLGWGMYRVSTRDAIGFPTPKDKRILLDKSVVAVWLSTMLDAAILYLPTVLAARYGSLEEVGKFSIAFRLMMVAVSFLVIIRGILGRQLILAYGKGDIARCELLSRRMMYYGLVMYSPLVLLFIFFGPILMQIFGKSFSGGESYLLILSAGQLIYAIFGMMGFVLIVMDKSQAEALLATGSVLFMILSAWFWQKHGVMAVAYAYAAATSLRSIASYVLARRRFSECINKK